MAGLAFMGSHQDRNWSWLQEKLAAWQGRNFGAPALSEIALGVGEEVGELHHAILKRTQRIRGMDDEGNFKEAAGDAIADATIYLIQLATALRLDFATLVHETAKHVMARDWVSNKQDGGL